MKKFSELCKIGVFHLILSIILTIEFTVALILNTPMSLYMSIAVPVLIVSNALFFVISNIMMKKEKK